MNPPARAHTTSGKGALATLSLAALGVVYGDIGTSPLYAVKACFTAGSGVSVTPSNVLGIVSLVFWALTLVIVVKYLTFVMRADNRGEGGVLALVALLKPAATGAGSGAWKLGGAVLLGLAGAALLYGEAAITPAVSVLAAVEGLGTGSAFFSESVIGGISVVILVAFFMFQRRGTAGVGAVFGPAMLLWFSTIAILGARWIAVRPGVLSAIDPRWAVRFLSHHGEHGFLVLGAVALCITGGEALYADMGHFGKQPIRLGWFAVVFPALLLNYFGQGALLLHAWESGAGAAAAAAENPFFSMVDGWARYPLVAIAAIAAIVASQALVSGAFSLTQSAVQLGYWPRVTIRHTSADARGQIYVPEMNAALLVGAVALALVFGTSTKLGAAYGIAVTGTMSITSILFYGVARRWGWGRLPAGLLTGTFLVVDLSFFAANAHRLREGSWVPLIVGAGVFTIMTTWHRGRLRLQESITRTTPPLELYLDLRSKSPHRVRGMLRIPGTAVFLTANTDGAPAALIHHLKHHKVLHERVVLLSIQTRDVPEVPPEARIEDIVDLGLAIYQVTAAYGFMQTPNALEILERCRGRGLDIDGNESSFFLGRETLVITPDPGMARWRKALFAYLSRNARPATAFFSIPSGRVVELGTHVEL